MSALRPLAFAFAAAAAAAVTAPTVAADGAPHYRAELSAPAAKPQVVAGGLLWRCEGTECRAAKDNSRPLTVCRKLAKETAAVVRFSVAGEELPADELTRCNG